MRIVSLVPSLTDTLFALGLGVDEIVGRTSWCVRPEGVVAAVPRLGGTKTPNVRRILELAPDLVLLDREENTRETHDALDAGGVPTWVAHALEVADIPQLLRELGSRVGREERGAALAAEVEAELATTSRVLSEGPHPVAVPLIWNEPLMMVAPSRYAGDLVRVSGFTVPDPEPEGNGYPVVSPELLAEAKVEVLLLTSEPHDFTQEEGDAVADAVARTGAPRPRALKVDGEALTWFGAHTVPALAWWRAFRARVG